MKKLLLGLLLVPLLLAACSAPLPCNCKCEVSCPTKTPEILPTQTPAPTATEKVWTYQDMVVGLATRGAESRWREANRASFKETANQLGITLTQLQTDQEFPVQYYFRGFLAQEGVNVIVVAADEATGWDDLLREARAAGKIVIVEDRAIDAPDDLYTTRISSDLVEEGRRAAAAMCDLLAGMPTKYVWELVGYEDSSTSIERGAGFHERMGECGIQIIRRQAGHWDTTQSKQVTEAWLKEGHDVQGIFAYNDDMALGVIEALKEAGLKPGTDVKIVSVDGTAAAFKAMVAGDLNVTVECSPFFAPQVYEAALRALNGEWLPKWIPVKEEVFYAKDAAELLPTRKY